MQQMTNILLPKAANNNASAGKASTPETRSEDFSAALASVNSVSSSTQKPSTSQERAIELTKSASSNDISQDEEDDVSLIFAQISMANEMKKTAAEGDKLPLLQEMDLDIGTSAVEAEGCFSSELDKLAELLVDSSDTDESGVALIAEADATKLPEVDITKLPEVDITKLPEVDATKLPEIESSLPTLIVETDLTTLAIHNGAVASRSSKERLEQDMLGDEEKTIEFVSQEGAKQERQGLVDVLPVMDVEGGDVGPFSVYKPSSSQQNIFTTSTKDINTIDNKMNDSYWVASSSSATIALSALGAAESIIVPANAELDESERLVTNVQLKDAKLAVTLESSSPTAFNLDDEVASEFKPVSVTTSPTQPQVNRQDIPQIQLSLRQGVETPNQMQEMIQRFSPVMKQQLITMVSNGIQHAEIRLDPPELGHMTVKIQVHGDQTQVQFHVTQSQTRDMVEQAIPRLRELLQEQGMQLADSHVSQGEQEQGRDGGFGESNGSESTNLDEFSAEELDLGLNQTTSLHSGIDYYA
ncbi:flagellar hook-length control protein FliK [Shewanella profunda]|uniref:Flagellar hook-length control protein-like, C-terminal domain protein n=1 Tax=Shewanella putrefaciens (strain 200) TaxID=399804 RepID=E6XGS0_SHEP2|nr:flagellar hook-length control protein FliK [Shewanella profunda]MCL1091286.1 flagellar hook-length control protein FliK [Shewanella profunda]